MLQFKVNKAIKDENGFAFTTKTGIYGTDYLMRALVTAIGLGANRPQDAVYPTPSQEGCGWPCLQWREQVRDAVSQRATCLPLKASGRSTMYDSGYFFVNNPLNRYSISARQDLKENPDGSTDLYIQKDSRAKTRNPTGFRRQREISSSCCAMYWPQETDPSIINAHMDGAGAKQKRLA